MSLASTVSDDGRPRLRRRIRIVPSDGRAGHSLLAVVAIMAFLAALAAGAASIVAASAAAWRGALAREATIQLRPIAGRDIETDVVRVAALARGWPGILGAEAVTRRESERLLEPWLGSGLDLADLPVPRLVTLTIDRAAKPDLSSLATRLAATAPGATLDDHGVALLRLRRAANRVVSAAIGIVLLITAASGAAIAFATRGALAGHRDVVEVLQLVGARDRFIARQFAWRFAWLGFRGGLIGSGLAAAFIWMVADRLIAPAAGQAQALFGELALGWTGYAAILAVPLAGGALAGLVAAACVRLALRASG